MWDGLKTFELRFNDRDFKVGNFLDLKETGHTGIEMKAGAPLKYTGRSLLVEVTYLLTGYGLSDGFCVMSVKAICHGHGD